MKKKTNIALFGAAYLLLTASALAQAPEKARVEFGEMAYTDYCSSCHGEKLRNTSEGVTFDLRKLREGEFERFRNSVLNGKNNMPPWQGVLSDDQIADIWSYIRVNAGT